MGADAEDGVANRGHKDRKHDVAGKDNNTAEHGPKDGNVEPNTADSDHKDRNSGLTKSGSKKGSSATASIRNMISSFASDNRKGGSSDTANSDHRSRKSSPAKQDRKDAKSSDDQQEGESSKKTWENPLPGTAQTWKDCPIDVDDNPFVQGLFTTLSKFDYPAAVFWGFELVLLYNQAWEDAGGIPQQGRAQRGLLSPDAWQALQKCINGGKPSRIASHALLRERSQPDQDKYMVLASPLFGPGRDDAKGVLCQMIHSESDNSNNKQVTIATKPSGVANMKDLGLEDDSTPLDEHPFFHRFAEMIPTGLAILDHNARAVFVNQHFYQLTTHWGEDQSFKSWPQSIHPDDYERVMSAYQRAFHGQSELRAEFRALGSDHPWRLLLLTPLGDENLRHVSLGEYGGFICSVVDITSEKSAENDQRIAAEEANERKQQQERFIDMISHEIRNPLSAMVHCVEDINDALKEKEHTGVVPSEPIAEALDTINLCISHQKNIVDDVLSYSKLDSSMLALTPKPCQPEKELKGNAKIFQPEFRKHNISFECKIDEPYNDLGVNWSMADLSRIGQVLINLISNAIKFTSRKEGERKIVVKISASIDRPDSYPPEVVFFSAENEMPRLDATQRSEWGTGDPLFIMVAVTDTGIGINAEDQKKLFERFRQATPKTNEIYGGSGLGLNISRKLVQLHGGEIGVTSTEGDGATFGFFFRVKRTDPPSEDDNDEERKKNAASARGQIRLGGLDSSEESKAENADESRKPQSTGGLARTQSSAERQQQTENLDQELGDAEAADEKDHKKREDREKKEDKKKKKDSEKEEQAHIEEQKPQEGNNRKRTDAENRVQADTQTGNGGKISNTGQSLDPTHSSVSHPTSRTVKDKAPKDLRGKGKGKEESLPTDTADSEKQQQQQQGARLPSQPRQENDSPSSDSQQPKLHVLLVEDNIINQKLVSRKLAGRNFAVSTAGNGQEAVDMVVASFSSSSSDNNASSSGSSPGPIDIILMDQEMPIMDGNAAAREIRSQEQKVGRDKRIPILGVSANVREEQLKEMVESGMDEYVTKPYKIDDMERRIWEMVGGKEGEMKE
jgi:signal transduction histidine kinase